MLCVQRCFSAHHCCNVCLFALLSLSFQLWPVWPLSSDLSHWQLISARRTTAHWLFFCISHHSLQTLETVVCENTRKLTVSEILEPPCLAPTIMHSQSHFDHNVSWSSWQYLHAFMPLVAATWLADSIFVLTSWCTGLPNEVVTECIISVIASLFFSLLYLYLVFGAPTAPRAFELLTRFKRSQFGTDLRQCPCISDSTAPSPSFSITPFIPSIFPLSWMGRCWLAKTNHMTIQSQCSRKCQLLA